MLRMMEAEGGVQSALAMRHLSRTEGEALI